MEDQQNRELINNQSLSDAGKIVIPVIEEQVVVGKKVIETGKVQISKVVYEDVERYAVPFIEEHVSVERIAKNEIVDTLPPAIRYEDDVMVISVLKEVAVVEKRVMLVEELRVTKSKTERTEAHDITLRKEEVKVTNTPVNTIT